MPMSVEWRPVAGAGFVGEGSSELSESSITAGGMGVWMNGVAGGGGRGLAGYARGVVTAGLLALRGIFFREEGSDWWNGLGDVRVKEAALGGTSTERWWTRLG